MRELVLGKILKCLLLKKFGGMTLVLHVIDSTETIRVMHIIALQRLIRYIITLATILLVHVIGAKHKQVLTMVQQHLVNLQVVPIVVLLAVVAGILINTVIRLLVRANVVVLLLVANLLLMDVLLHLVANLG